MDRCCNKTSNYNSKQIFCFRISSSLKVISISHREKRYRRIGRINICRDKDNLQLQKNYVRTKSSFHSLLICVCSAARGLCFSDSSSKNVNKKCGAPAVIGLSRNDFIIISSPPSHSHQNFLFILLKTKVFYSTKKNSVKFHKETIIKIVDFFYNFPYSLDVRSMWGRGDCMKENYHTWFLNLLPGKVFLACFNFELLILKRDFFQCKSFII